jgi:putative ABC transport system ATP-binding protein
MNSQPSEHLEFARAGIRKVGIEGQYAIQTRYLSRVFQLGTRKIHALQEIDFAVQRGEFVAIMGASGCGKSTLLALLGGLDAPSFGSVLLEGRDLNAMTQAERVALRRGGIGYIFQGYDLLPALSVLENVEYPLLVSKIPHLERRERALKMLLEVGLVGKEDFLPDELSGGQQQRVGIARCLVCEPRIVLADEPTGNLDTTTTTAILELLKRAIIKRNMTLVIVTHDSEVAAHADRIVYLHDGKIEAKS